MNEELPVNHPDRPENFRKAGEFILGKTVVYIPPTDSTPLEYKKEEVTDVR